MISKTLPLIEQICENRVNNEPLHERATRAENELTSPRTTQVYNLRTSISILLQPHTAKAIERVADPLPTADNTFVLVVTETALVADAHKRRGSHVGIADGAFAVAFVAETADCDAGLLTAHDEIWVMA